MASLLVEKKLKMEQENKQLRRIVTKMYIDVFFMILIGKEKRKRRLKIGIGSFRIFRCRLDSHRGGIPTSLVRLTMAVLH